MIALLIISTRVAKLYLMSKYFVCRHCLDLVYSSQREGNEFRILYKAQKIYKRLGANNHDGLFITPKPKGMHQITDQLCDEAIDLELKSLQTLMRKLLQISAHLEEHI